MKFIPATIPDVILIEPQVFCDSRGYFLETYQAQKFALEGITDTFVQDNHSGSQRGTLRGLHYQIQSTQGKLVKVTRGEVFDVAVDLRQSSPTFGNWVGFWLSAENKNQLWVPKGFAHGFYVVSDWADLIYKVTDYYAPEWERTLLWDDPDIGIEWPLTDGTNPILSAKDAQGDPLSKAEKFD
jgi:dTDP-4-dehydrorhamnose 3,5-epimerase